jgi:hypothetical protein
MKCPSCDAENPADAKVCVNEKCGVPFTEETPNVPEPEDDDEPEEEPQAQTGFFDDDGGLFAETGDADDAE